MSLVIFSSKKLSLHSVKDVIIISPDNNKAIKAVNDLMDAKAAFKKFIAEGGKAEDFKKNTKVACLPHTQLK
jgi:hypothetical protein